jgi:hypothetical protein
MSRLARLAACALQAASSRALVGAGSQQQVGSGRREGLPGGARLRGLSRAARAPSTRFNVFSIHLDDYGWLGVGCIPLCRPAAADRCPAQIVPGVSVAYRAFRERSDVRAVAAAEDWAPWGANPLPPPRINPGRDHPRAPRHLLAARLPGLPQQRLVVGRGARQGRERGPQVSSEGAAAARARAPRGGEPARARRAAAPGASACARACATRQSRRRRPRPRPLPFPPGPRTASLATWPTRTSGTRPGARLGVRARRLPGRALGAGRRQRQRQQQQQRQLQWQQQLQPAGVAAGAR